MTLTAADHAQVYRKAAARLKANALGADDPFAQGLHGVLAAVMALVAEEYEAIAEKQRAAGDEPLGDPDIVGP